MHRCCEQLPELLQENGATQIRCTVCGRSTGQHANRELAATEWRWIMAQRTDTRECPCAAAAGVAPLYAWEIEEAASRCRKTDPEHLGTVTITVDETGLQQLGDYVKRLTGAVKPGTEKKRRSWRDPAIDWLSPPTLDVLGETYYIIHDFGWEIVPEAGGPVRVMEVSEEESGGQCRWAVRYEDGFWEWVDESLYSEKWFIKLMEYYT